MPLLRIPAICACRGISRILQAYPLAIYTPSGPDFAYMLRWLMYAVSAPKVILQTMSPFRIAMYMFRELQTAFMLTETTLAVNARLTICRTVAR